MSNKKVILSVTASAAIASMIFGANEIEAATHKVQSGESLWSIAQQYNTTISKLKSINKLSSDQIYPNQMLVTGTNGVKLENNSNSKLNQTKNVTAYRVKSGDTLSAIAVKYRVTVADLMKWNKLSDSLIFPGDMLKVREKGEVTENGNISSRPNNSVDNVEGRVPDQAENVNQAATNTYTVKSGDTLSAIAFKYKVSVEKIMEWNRLKSTLIIPGDKLVIKQNLQQSDLKEEAITPNNSYDSKPVSTYTVKLGDSLWKIATMFNVTIDEIKQWNNITTNTIYAGQHLKIQTNVTTVGGDDKELEPSESPVSYSVDKLINVAKRFIGVPYVWGGSSPDGFDCSGFIYFSFRQAGMELHRYSSEGFYDRSYYVNKPKLGDLVFFKNTYKSGISHVGIYLGNNQFINANSSGVTIDTLENAYWKKHFDSFKRFY